MGNSDENTRWGELKLKITAAAQAGPARTEVDATKSGRYDHI